MIYFLHIPKTGGQALATRLATAFPAERVSVLQADVPDRAALARLAAAFDFFEGHPGGAILAGRPAGLRVMTVVRDPVEQVISHYRHILREPANVLQKAAAALPPAAFLTRFAHHMFNFQARSLVFALTVPSVQDRMVEEDLWLLRHLEAAAAQMDWLVPTEAIDEFCLLWSAEGGRPLGLPALRVNEGGQDGVDAAALRRWLREHPELIAVDSLLWRLARQRHARWRQAVIGTDRATGLPAPGARAFAEGEAAVWLLQDWHPPAQRADGVTEWWAGPGFTPRLRVRRGPHATLRFEALTFLGVRWEQIRLLRERDLAVVPLEARLDPATHVVSFTAGLDALGEDETLAMVTFEGIRVLPPVPLAYEGVRRGFATQNWRLA